jgi:hypothetical protein
MPNKIRKVYSTFSESEQAIKNRIFYWKHVKDMQEAHDVKVKSVTFRNKILKGIARTNYQNEYDRLRGILAHTVIPQQTKDNINARIKQLEGFQIS